MRLAGLLVSLMLVAPQAPPQTLPPVREGDVVFQNVRFADGKVLPELRIHYRTLGPPSGEPVLILHGTANSGERFLTPAFASDMFGKGQPLDVSKYFVILPDAIGHGGSSKPSDGLRMTFPEYTYGDMVSAQHRLVTEHLGIRRLRLIIGGSMGGMHAWLWATTYPEAMDAIMPLQCLPVEIAGMNRMLRRAVTDSIRADPDWRNGEYTAQPRRALAAIEYGWIALFGDPLALMTAAPTRAQADRMFDARVEARQRGTDVNDTLYQLEASRDYNPAPDLGRIRARVFAANTEDDSVNPPYLGVMEPAIAKIPRASYVVIPRGAGTAGHGSYSIGKLYTRFVADILNRR